MFGKYVANESTIYWGFEKLWSDDFDRQNEPHGQTKTKVNDEQKSLVEANAYQTTYEIAASLPLAVCYGVWKLTKKLMTHLVLIKAKKDKI